MPAARSAPIDCANQIVAKARTPLARIGTTTHAAMNSARRFQLTKQMLAASSPKAIIATRNFTPEQASATSNRPAGVSMKTPSMSAGIPLASTSAIVILAVRSWSAGTSSSPIGTSRNA